MINKLNRRSFLTSAACGLGTIAFSSAKAPFMQTSSTTSTIPKGKKLIATTDYEGNVEREQVFFNRTQMDEMHKYLSSIGVTRHQWIYNTNRTLYDIGPSGFDTLAEAVESAHTHGLEFYALIKPFEGGGSGATWLPHSMPFPNGSIALKDMRGIYPIARPFVARNPHMCLKRRPGSYEFHGPVTSIRLVKGDDQPTRIRPEHLSLWTSSSNNRFSRYKGPLTFRESIEWRPTFPGPQSLQVIGNQYHILHLEGLKIPVDHKYILVRCSLFDEHGDFTNERGNIVELVGPDHENIPFILSTGPIDYEALREELLHPRSPIVSRYFQLPEVQAILKDSRKWKEHFQDFYYFGERKLTDLFTLDKEGYVAVACGKPEYLLGNLHPIYPEVREHWLDMVRYCLDRGVDGINIRQAQHTVSAERWEYGFNDPVLEAAGGKTDYVSICRVNGDAYTQFLREARNLIKNRGKSLTIHLNAQMLAPDDRGNILRYPPNFEWQWEKWVREIADDLDFRGYWFLRPWNLPPVLDKFISVAKAENKPLYFQGRFRELTFDGPNHRLRWELELIRNYPELAGFNIYETLEFTRINQNGEFEGSPDVANLIKTLFF